MDRPKIQKRHTCRICGGSALKRFLLLPEMPFTDDFIAPEIFGSEFRADIDIFICVSCLCAQTQHDVEVGDYYKNYQYSVGGSTTASRFMRILAENSIHRYRRGIKNPKVLEIGSGDGEQLAAFRDVGCRVLGYEPSSSLCRIAEAKGIPTIQGLFSAESISKLPDEFKEVDVVMLSYTFDHLPEPRAFTSAARSILRKSDGLLVVEIHNLERIAHRNEYCLFEHEHSIYLTEATVVELCRREGLTVIDFNLVPEADRRANSLIFVATPNESMFATQPVTPSTPMCFNDVNYYFQIAEGVKSAIKNLERFIDSMTANNRTVAGYGAGGRGVMTLAAMNNSSKIRYLVDKKPKNMGLVAPKSGVRVVGIGQLSREPVDSILVFSCGYMEEIYREVGLLGYRKEQFHSLFDVLTGRF